MTAIAQAEELYTEAGSAPGKLQRRPAKAQGMFCEEPRLEAIVLRFLGR